MLLFSDFTEGARRSRKININGPLKKQLNMVLKNTVKLHKSSVKGNRVKVSTSVRSLLKSISKAQKTSKASIKHRTHLYKMLSYARINLEMTQMQKGKSRKKSFKKAFKQLVYVAKTYNLDRYRIYFCPKDRSIWLQKPRKPWNPFNPKKYRSCGKLVPQ